MIGSWSVLSKRNSRADLAASTRPTSMSIMQHMQSIWRWLKANVATGEPVLVRMHALSVFRDVLGDLKEGRVGELQAAMNAIGEAGRGVIVLICEPWSNTLSDKMRQRDDSPPSSAKPDNALPVQLRDYGVGAQILLDLGVREMILLSNSNRQVVGLEGYGLRIVDRKPIPVAEE